MEVLNEEELAKHSVIKVPNLLGPSFILNHGAVDMKVTQVFLSILASLRGGNKSEKDLDNSQCFFRYARLGDPKVPNNASPRGGCCFYIKYYEFEKLLKFSVALCHSEELFKYEEARNLARSRMKEGHCYTVKNVDLNLVPALEAIETAIYVGSELRGLGGSMFIADTPKKEEKLIDLELGKIRRYLYGRVGLTG